MKKLLALAFAVLSIGFVASSADAATVSSSPKKTVAAPQRGWQYGHYNRPVRVRIETRIVRRGRRLFRETYRVTYFPYGRKQTTLVSRVRIR